MVERFPRNSTRYYIAHDHDNGRNARTKYNEQTNNEIDEWDGHINSF